jgi:hypothetical protein
MMHRHNWAGPRASNPTCFAWIVWDRSHTGPTTINRITWKDSKSFAVVGADGGSESRAPRGEDKMDMSKYSGSAFLKVADIEAVAGPVRVVIHNVQLGAYAKPDLTFDDGTKLSVNVTNNKILCQAYGTESSDWINMEIDLVVGEVDFQGKPQKTIVIQPVTPPAKKKAPKRKKLSDEMGDEIDF